MELFPPKQIFAIEDHNASRKQTRIYAARKKQPIISLNHPLIKRNKEKKLLGNNTPRS